MTWRECPACAGADATLSCKYCGGRRGFEERPILFSGPMVRAILNGRKTQTRRIVKQLVADPGCARLLHTDPVHGVATLGHSIPDDPVPLDVPCPYGAEGDRLWVRETFGLEWVKEEYFWNDANGGSRSDLRWACGGQEGERWYYADGEAPGETEHGGHFDKRPSIHMPRWASRINLEVTGVRAERVQEITGPNAAAEGIAASTLDCRAEHLGRLRCDRFADLWDEINGKRDGCSWADNPWVWVVEFSRILP